MISEDEKNITTQRWIMRLHFSAATQTLTINMLTIFHRYFKVCLMFY